MALERFDRFTQSHVRILEVAISQHEVGDRLAFVGRVGDRVVLTRDQEFFHVAHLAGQGVELITQAATIGDEWMLAHMASILESLNPTTFSRYCRCASSQRRRTS